MAVFEKVADLISEHLKIDRSLINQETNIMEDLGANSLDIIELVMKIEDYFGVTIADEDIMNVRTVKEVADYLEGRMH